MSRCRCKDMKKCQEKINKLDRAKVKAWLYPAYAGATRRDLELMKMYVEKSDEIPLSHDETLMRNLADDMDSAKNDIINKITDKRDALKKEYNKMKKEDKDYHKSKHKK